LKLQIVIDGTAYEVEVEKTGDDDDFVTSLGRPDAAAIQSSVVPTVANPLSRGNDNGNVDESKVCRSPVAGIVIEVEARPGQAVAVNDLIVVLEAMKMETRINAPISGKVKSIKVAPGDAVKLNQILVDFE
jgi:methylmalonyl-CoA carboxyltransferase 1.3S subunit